MAEIHHFPVPARIPTPGLRADDRVRCPVTGKTGTVYFVARTGIVTVEWDGAPGGRFARNPDRLERLAPAHDPAVVVRLPHATLRRDAATGAAHWTSEAAS